MPSRAQISSCKKNRSTFGSAPVTPSMIGWKRLSKTTLIALPLAELASSNPIMC